MEKSPPDGRHTGKVKDGDELKTTEVRRRIEDTRAGRAWESEVSPGKTDNGGARCRPARERARGRGEEVGVVGGVPTRRGMQIRNAWAESGEGRRASQGAR